MFRRTRRARKRRATKPARRLTLRDLMVIVATTGVAIWLAKMVMPEALVLPKSSYYSAIKSYYEPATLFVSVWAAMLIVLRLTPPRPDRKRILRQPGFVACVSILASLIYGGAGQAWFEFVIAHQHGLRALLASYFWWGSWERTPEFVVGGWSALWLGGRWSPSSDWIDQWGRVLGWFCIVQAAGSWVVPAIIILFILRFLRR